MNLSAPSAIAAKDRRLPPKIGRCRAAGSARFWRPNADPVHGSADPTFF